MKNPLWTRESVKRHLAQRFYTRFHMSLILSSSALCAMLANWLLLHGGVAAMWVRYPLAIAVAYGAFLGGVGLWLRYVGLDGGTERRSDGVDFGDSFSTGGGNSSSSSGSSFELPAPRGGGGQFGGGGASSSWAEGEALPAAGLSAPAEGSSDSGFKLGDLTDVGSDSDGLVVVILALLLIAAVFFVSGYVIWFAPDILSEAAFGALLAGGLAKTAKREDRDGWVSGVVKKTWWPFAIVLALALAFTLFAANSYPQAKTFRETLQAASAD